MNRTSWTARVRHGLTAALLLIVASAAFAHANLDEAEPGANVRLDAPPEAIRLVFTEPVEQTFSRLQLFALSGTVIAQGSAVDPADPFALVLRVPAGLENGIYTVSWRAVSTSDGHTTQGSYAFGVGMAAGTRAVVAIDESIRLESAAGRWMDMIGTALTLGVAVFALLVWRTGDAQGLPSRDARFASLMRCGWLVAGAGLLTGLLSQAASVSGGSPLSAMADGSAMRMLADSSFGSVWLGRLLVWVAFGALVTRESIHAPRWKLVLGLAAAMAVLPSLVSHARAFGSDEALLNDMLHRLTAALWVGGLIAWVAALWPDFRLQARPVALAVSRFSNLARFYVLLLALGGLFAALQHVPAPEALTDTGYGRALTMKGFLFAAMILLAGFNLLVVERRLKQGEDGWVETLRLTVSAEMMLGAALMLMSGIMASSVPSRDVLALRAQAAEMAALPQAEPYFGMEIQDGVMMHFEVYPGVAGENEFVVGPYLEDDGTPLSDATRVRMRFTHLEQNLGESVLEALPDGQGQYVAIGSNLSIPGPWRVRVTLQRPGEFDTVIDFDLTIPLP